MTVCVREAGLWRGYVGPDGEKKTLCFNHQHLFSHAVFHSLGPLAQSIETCAKNSIKIRVTLKLSESAIVFYSLCSVAQGLVGVESLSGIKHPQRLKF